MRNVYSDAVRDVVRELYQEGVALKEIERDTGVLRETITKWVVTHNWKRSLNGRQHAPELVDKCRQLWESGTYSNAEIERITDVTRGTLYRWIRLYGWSR